jgi:site-specific DNA recombinase
MTKPAADQKLRAALYARYSSDLQKDTSVEDQFALLEKVAKRLDLQLDKRHYFADRAQSGTTLFDRPGLTRDLLGAAQRKEFDCVLVEATDRLSRDQADLFWLAKNFNFHGIKIFNQSGEVSDLQLTFDGHANADYIKKLAMRVKRGHDSAAAKGRIVTAPAYGYDVVLGKPGERTINKTEAKVVRRIFAEYAAGKTPSQIVAGLAKDKIPSPSGAPFWNPQVIVGGVNKRGLLHNRLYIGEYVKNRFYNVKNPETGKRVTRKADETDLIVVPLPHLRIVEQHIWDAAHTLRTERGFKKFPSGYHAHRSPIPRKEHLLAGLLRCAECGGLMTVTASSRIGQRVGCSSAAYRKTCGHSKTYDLGKLTEGAIDHMHAHLTDPDFIKERALARAQEAVRLSRQENEERKAAQRQLDRLTVQIKRLVEAIADGDGSVKELMQTIKDKEIERVALQERLRLLGAETSVSMHPTVLSTFGKSVETLHSKLKKNPKDPQCRLAFANIIDSVVVHATPKAAPYEISIYARISAITGIDLFPAKRTVKEIVAAEGLPRSGSLTSHPPSSRRFTGWSSR